MTNQTTPDNGALTIERVTSVDARLAAELDPLFDEGMTWNATTGARFLANPDNLLLVARWRGVACGFATAYRLQRFDDRRAEVNLYELGVDEQFRRRGVGRALVEAVRDWAVSAGATETWVLTELDNSAALATYAAAGGNRAPDLAVMFTWTHPDGA